MPQIRHLDQEWFDANLNIILPKDDEKVWWETMAAYLAFQGPVYLDFFKVFREHDHYQRAIKKDISDEQTLRSLVQHICISYLHENDNLDDSDSLISLLLAERKAEYHQEIVRYIPSVINRNEDVDFDDKTEQLWDRLLETAEALEPEESKQEFFSELGSWIGIVDELNEKNFKRLSKSAAYTKRYFKDHDFIKGLDKHCQSEPLRAGLLFQEMLTGVGLPDYDKDEIRNIVTALLRDSADGSEELGIKICNKYFAAGSSLLRDVCEKYGPSNSSVSD